MVGIRPEPYEMWGPFVSYTSTSFWNKSIFKSVEGRSTFLRNVVTCLQNYKIVTSQKAVICSVASTNVSFNLLKLPLRNNATTYFTPGQYYCSDYCNLLSCSNPHIRLQQGVKTNSTKTSHEMSLMYKLPVVHSSKHPLILPHTRLFPLYLTFLYTDIFSDVFVFAFTLNLRFLLAFYNVKNCVVFWKRVVFVHFYSSLL